MKRQPLKRHKALVELSKDHHFGLLLCWKIRSGFQRNLEAERIAGYVRYFFQDHLREHFQLEEELIFPCFSPGNPLREEVEKQHQELYELEEKLSRETPVLKEVLKEFEEKLEKHIRFEERQLFMELQEILSEEELQNLQLKVEARHQKKDEEWRDRFWE